MNRVKLYNFTTSTWDLFEGEFERDGQFSFDFPTDNYLDGSGNVKVVVQRLVGESWQTVTGSSSSSLTEAETTGSYIKLDKDGFMAYNGTKNTMTINSQGAISIEGNITATGGSFTGPVTIGAGGSLALGTSVVLDSTGLKMNSGSIDISNGVFKVTAAGALTATSATITGVINATSGYFGTGSTVVSVSSAGLNVGTTGQITNTAATFTLNNSGVTATAGTIAGWTLGSTTLSKNNVTLDSAGSIKLGASNQVVISSASGINIGSGQFTVSLAGALTAQNATITGTVNSTAGYFGTSINGVSITSEGLNIVGTGIIRNINSEMTANAFIVYDGEPNVAVMLGEYAAGKFGLSAAGGNVILDKLGLKIAGSDTSIKLGTPDGEGKYPFEVKADGSLYGRSATISGDITATSGKFSGTINVLTGGQIIAGNGVGDHVKMNETGIYVIKGGAPQNAITSAGIYGQLLTNQSVPGTSFDRTPPPVPDSTFITLSSTLDQTSNGDISSLVVKWKEVTDTDGDLSGYKIFLKEAGKEYLPHAIVQKYNASEPTTICEYDTVNKIYTYSIRNLKANVTYYVRIASYDVQNNTSLLSGEKSFLIAPDAAAPVKVTGLAITTAFKSLAVKWTKLTDVDLNYYILQRSESTDGTNFNAWHTIANVSTDFVIDEGLDYETYYRYRVCGMDYSGNSGNWSDISSAVKPSRIGRNDIVANSITTELLKIGSIVKSINREETTLFHFDGTLMSTQGLTPYTDESKIVHQNGFFKKEAKFGASLSIEEDTENLVATVTNGNANLRGTTDGWIVGADCTFKTTNGVDGIDDGYLEIGYADGLKINLTVVPGKTYNISSYAKKVTSNSIFRIDVQPLDGDLTKWSASAATGSLWQDNILKQVVNQIPNIEWSRYNNSFTVPTTSNTTTIRLHIHQNGGADLVAVDSIQVEQRAYATSFINGTKKEGYVDYYASSLINHLTGVVAFWTKNIIGWHNVVDNDHPDDSPYVDNWFIWGKESSANKILAKYNRENSTLTITYGNTSLNYVFPGSILNDDWIHFAYEWHDGLQTLYINGVAVATSTGAAISKPEDDLFRLGYFPRVDGSSNIIEEDNPIAQNKRARASLMFDEFRIDKVVRDIDEITSWYNQDAAFYDAAAQIDADSQNISAANASVIINNEGITVRDGKISVESDDGKILLKDGRLSVNGLDVGVPQSDNGIYNGNFTIPDITHSMSDTYIYIDGMARFGAKYWKIKRSSLPVKQNMALSVAWKGIDVTNFIDGSQIKASYYSNVVTSVKYVISLSPYDPTVDPQAQNTTYQSYALGAALNSLGSSDPIKMAFTAYPTAIAICASELNTRAASVVDTLFLDTRTNVNNAIATSLTTSLTAAGVDATSRAIMIGFTQAVAYTTDTTGSLVDVKSTVEYATIAAIMQQAPTLSTAAKTSGKKAARIALNQYINNYSTTDSELGTTIATSIATSGIPALEQSVLIPLASAVVIGDLPNIPGANTLAKETIETTTEREVEELYTTLIGYTIGLVEYNDATGEKVTKLYHIDEAGNLYEIFIDIYNINIDTAIDPVTGLPPTDTTPTLGGNTEVYLYPFDRKYGREGYTELTVKKSAPSDVNVTTEYIEISQVSTGLTAYTDGVKARGTNYRQNTFSFNAAWKEDASHNFICGQTGKLTFEVEELIPVRPRLRNFITGQFVYTLMTLAVGQNTIIVSDTAPFAGISTIFLGEEKFTVMAVDSQNKAVVLDHPAVNTHSALSYVMKDYVTDVNGYFTLYPTEEIYISDYHATLSDIIMANTINTQYIVMGNATFDMDTMSYTVHSIIAADTLFSSFQPMTPRADGPYSYDINMNGNPIPGYVVSGIWYNEDIAAEDRPSYTPNWQVIYKTSPEGNANLIETDKKGDFAIIGAYTYSNGRVDVDIWHSPDSGIAFSAFDGDRKASDFSFPVSGPFNITLDDFPEGEHQIIILNIGMHGVSTDPTVTNPKVCLTGLRMYDWQKVNAGPNNINNIVEWTKDEVYRAGVLTDEVIQRGKWNPVYIEPKYANSVDESGTPLFPEMTPVKYKVSAKVSKNEADTETSTAFLTGIQAELGTNPSYTRQANGRFSIPGYMIQPYNSSMWNTSGIKSRHYEDYLAGYPGETGIQERHISDGQITSTKVADGVIVSSHIAKGNITFDKIRQKRMKLNKTALTLEDFIMYQNNFTSTSQITSGLRSVYEQYIIMAADADVNSFLVPAYITQESEIVVKNGQMLEYTEDYEMFLYTGMIAAKDIWNVAKEYGMNVGTTERPLSMAEHATLGNLLKTTNLYDANNRSAISGTPLVSALASYDVVLYTKVVMVVAPQSVNGYTDKYRIIFWEEL